METESGSEEEYYEVDKIVDHKYNEQKKVQYRVRWKGYPPSQDTWEPEEHLGAGCDEIITAYFEQKAVKIKQKKKQNTAATKQTAAKKPPNLPKSPRASSPSISSKLSSAMTLASPNISPDKFSTSDTGSVTTAATADSLTTLTGMSRSSPLPVTVKEVKVEKPTHVCTHTSQYDTEKATNYEKLTMKYELRTQQHLTENITDSRRCMTVLMSRLCDPEETDVLTVLDELQACLRHWNETARRREPMTLITSILLQDEEETILEREKYKPSVNQAVPGNWTPLHFASVLHKFKVCDWLLDEEAWPDIININQETPLTLTFRQPAKGESANKLLRLIKRLVTKGANVTHAMQRAKALKGSSHNSLAVDNYFTQYGQRLAQEMRSLMAPHLQQDNLSIKNFFVEPQIITQPAGLPSTIKFKFRDPGEPCVNRLTVAYYIPKGADTVDLLSSKLHFTTEGSFPFKSIKLNGTTISPKDGKYCTSISLKSELVVGQNVLEFEKMDDQEVMADSILVFGCMIVLS